LSKCFVLSLFQQVKTCCSGRAFNFNLGYFAVVEFVQGRHKRDCHLRENELNWMGWNNNRIGFENTTDYCLWMVNKIMVLSIYMFCITKKNWTLSLLILNTIMLRVIYVDCHKKSIMLVIMLNAILLNVLATSKVSSMVVEKSNHHPNVKRFESRHHCHQQRLGTRGGGWNGKHNEKYALPGNPYWRGRITALWLLELTSLDHLAFILKILVS